MTSSMCWPILLPHLLATHSICIKSTYVVGVTESGFLYIGNTLHTKSECFLSQICPTCFPEALKISTFPHNAIQELAHNVDWRQSTTSTQALDYRNPRWLSLLIALIEPLSARWHEEAERKLVQRSTQFQNQSGPADSTIYYSFSCVSDSYLLERSATAYIPHIPILIWIIDLI